MHYLQSPIRDRKPGMRSITRRYFSQRLPREPRAGIRGRKEGEMSNRKITRESFEAAVVFHFSTMDGRVVFLGHTEQQIRAHLLNHKIRRRNRRLKDQRMLCRAPGQKGVIHTAVPMAEVEVDKSPIFAGMHKATERETVLWLFDHFCEFLRWEEYEGRPDGIENAAIYIRKKADLPEGYLRQDDGFTVL